MPVSGETGQGEYSARRTGPVVPGALPRPGKSGGGGGADRGMYEVFTQGHGE